MASESNSHSTANRPNLVDEFEEAFQGIVNSFIKEDGLPRTQDNKDELRTDAEQNVAKFIEVAKQLEIFFLQKRMQLSILKPEQIIKEDCAELRQEIARKDELIKKHYEKIATWQSMIGEPQPPVGMIRNGVPASSEMVPQPGQPQLPQQMPPQPPMQMPQQLPPQPVQPPQNMMPFQNR